MHSLWAQGLAKIKHPLHPRISLRQRCRLPATIQFVSEIKTKEIRMAVQSLGTCLKVEINCALYRLVCVESTGPVKSGTKCAATKPTGQHCRADIQTALRCQFHEFLKPVEMAIAYPSQVGLKIWPEQNYADMIGPKLHDGIQIAGNIIASEIIPTIPPLLAWHIVYSEAERLKGCGHKAGNNGRERTPVSPHEAPNGLNEVGGATPKRHRPLSPKNPKDQPFLRRRSMMTVVRLKARSPQVAGSGTTVITPVV